MESYTSKIIYYMNNPKFLGKLDNYTIYVEDKSEFCGDKVDLFCLFENGFVKDLKYKFTGCSLNIASFEILIRKIIGANLDEFENILENALELVSNELDFPQKKIHCIELAIESLQKVLNKLRD